jgi:hypothetical protein
MLYIRLEMYEYDLEVKKFIEMCDYLIKTDENPFAWAGQVTAQEYASIVQIIDGCCAHTAESLPGSDAHRELTRPRRSKEKDMKINLGLGDFPAAKTDGSNVDLHADGRVRSWEEPLRGYTDCSPVTDGEKEKLLKGLEGIRSEHVAKWGAPISPQPPLTLEYIQKLVSDAMEASIALTNELGDAGAKIETLKKQFEDREKVQAALVQSRPSYSTEDYVPDSPKYRLEFTRNGETKVIEGVQLPSWLPETGLYEVFVEKE